LFLPARNQLSPTTIVPQPACTTRPYPDWKKHAGGSRRGTPISFKNTAAAGFLPPAGTQWDIGYVRYVLNPGPTEVAANILTTYPDNEYATEFTAAPLDVKTTASIWNRNPLNALNVPGPLYKWVRINAVSEVSLKLDVDNDTFADSTTPLYYDGSLSRFSNSSSVGPQVLEITSFATLPNGSQKLVQYLVVPFPVGLPAFLAALTLSGSNGSNPCSTLRPIIMRTR